MYLLHKVGWTWQGFIYPYSPEWMRSRAVPRQCALLGGWGWIRAHLRKEPQFFVRDQGGGHSAAASWLLHTARPPWDKLSSSVHGTTGKWLVRLARVLIVFLIHEIYPKCQIADSPPSDWKLLWKCLMLFTCVWKSQSVRNWRNFNSLSCSDRESRVGFPPEIPVQYGMRNVCAA